MTTLERTPGTPDLLVEKLALGELPPAAAAAVRARLERAGELHRLEALGTDSPSGSMPAELALRIAQRRAREAARRKVHARSWALLVTAASLAMMALVIASPFGGDTSRMKGGDAALIIYRQTDSGYEVLAEGATLRRGDVLQLGLRAGRARVAAVYSIDGRGLITEHQAPREVPGPAELRLADAYQLDDAPRFERFLLVLGDTLDAQQIRAALASLAAQNPGSDPLDIPGAQVISRLFPKAPP